MRDTKKAFCWIVDILESHNITYQISGGFAARVYGVNRELLDIDIEMLNSDILKIIDDVKPYITFGPARYIDEKWNLERMTLKFEGQEVDISGTEFLIFNQKTEEWEECSSNLENIEIREVFGKRVPIESLGSLIAYKSKLTREVDLDDIRQLKALKNQS